MSKVGLPIPETSTAHTGRRRFLAGLTGLALSAKVPAATERPSVRIGFTPAFVHDQYALLDDWRRYMERRLGMAVVFKQHDSYQDTMDLLRHQQMDFAWLSDYPFLALKNRVRLLAVPLYKRKPLYRSFIIVPVGNRQAAGLRNLKNTVFAYADPLSNSGYLYPRFAIHKMGENPQTFFRKTFFTWSHKKVVVAVALGLAQGGAVDSYVWESLERLDPALTRRTRIVEHSPEYGFPPFVANREVSPALFDQVRNFLITMHQDAEGAALLKRINLDGFIKGDMHLYDGVAEMMRSFGESEGS